MEKCKQIELLAKIPDQFPLVEEPYKEIAGTAGMNELELMGALKEMKASGIIRRVAAILSHRRISYSHNAMVVWKVDQGEIEKTGRIMASFTEVSHCYERGTDDYWDYNVYTMVHGRSREGCLRTIEDIARKTALTEYRIFFSAREFKKTSFSVSHE